MRRERDCFLPHGSDTIDTVIFELPRTRLVIFDVIILLPLSDDLEREQASIRVRCGHAH